MVIFINDKIKEWRTKEILAEKVNHSPPIDGICLWKCEVCSKEWNEPVDLECDRTKDHTNWPVHCLECTQKFIKEFKENL